MMVKRNNRNNLWILKDFNIADYFSFYRVLVSPLLIVLIVLGYQQVFVWFLLISYLTDMVDGFLARMLKITSARGSQLDSIGDQITFVLGMVGLYVFEHDFIMSQLTIILFVFILYGSQMFLAFRKYGKTTAFHTYFAKVSAFVQGLFILWALFLGPLEWLFYTMIIIGVLETIEEVILIFMLDEWTAGVKGIYWAQRDKKQGKLK